MIGSGAIIMPTCGAVSVSIVTCRLYNLHFMLFFGCDASKMNLSMKPLNLCVALVGLGKELKLIHTHTHTHRI
jgi:hypothetical protein